MINKQDNVECGSLIKLYMKDMLKMESKKDLENSVYVFNIYIIII